MLRKKSVVIVLALILLIVLSGQALAADAGPAQITSIITPMWVNIDQAGANLTFSGNRADCSAYVIGKVGTSQITGSAVLSRMNADGSYTAVTTWNNLISNTRYLDFGGSYYVTAGYTYRLALTATVYKSGSSETVTVYSSANC